MEEKKDACCCSCNCNCCCHKMIWVFVALIGLTFLLGGINILSQNVAGIVWPSLIILAGLSQLCSCLCKCCGSSKKDAAPGVAGKTDGGGCCH